MLRRKKCGQELSRKIIGYKRRLQPRGRLRAGRVPELRNARRGVLRRDGRQQAAGRLGVEEQRVVRVVPRLRSEVNNSL